MIIVKSECQRGRYWDIGIGQATVARFSRSGRIGSLQLPRHPKYHRRQVLDWANRTNLRELGISMIVVHLQKGETLEGWHENHGVLYGSPYVSRELSAIPAYLSSVNVEQQISRPQGKWFFRQVGATRWNPCTTAIQPRKSDVTLRWKRGSFFIYVDDFLNVEYSYRWTR